jgi:hypothetical protein
LRGTPYTFQVLENKVLKKILGAKNDEVNQQFSDGWTKSLLEAQFHEDSLTPSQQ